MGVDFSEGQGIKISEMVGLVGDGMELAASVPAWRFTPLGLGMQFVGSTMSAISLTIPDGERLFVDTPRPASPIQVTGTDFYKDAAGNLGVRIITVTNSRTGLKQITSYAADGKLQLTVQEKGGGQFEITPAGGVPSILTVNPLSPESARNAYGEPIKGSTLNPAGTSGKISDAADFAIDDAILAELQDTFGGDAAFDPYAVDYAAVGDDNALAMVGVEFNPETDFLTGTNAQVYAQVGDNNIVMLASLAVSVSDAGNGYFIPTIQTINGQAPVNGALLNNVIGQDEGVISDLLSGVTSSDLTHIVEAGDATNADGTLPSLVAVTGRVDWWNAPDFLNTPELRAAVGPLNSVIALLRGGSSLAIATNFVNLASHVFKDPAVAQIAAALSGISSLDGLKNALEKGDLGRILIDGGGVARSALTIYSNSLQQEMISRFGSVFRAGELATNGNVAATELYNSSLGADSLLKGQPMGIIAERLPTIFFKQDANRRDVRQIRTSCRFSQKLTHRFIFRKNCRILTKY